VSLLSSLYMTANHRTQLLRVRQNQIRPRYSDGLGPSRRPWAATQDVQLHILHAPHLAPRHIGSLGQGVPGPIGSLSMAARGWKDINWSSHWYECSGPVCCQFGHCQWKATGQRKCWRYVLIASIYYGVTEGKGKETEASQAKMIHVLPAICSTAVWSKPYKEAAPAAEQRDQCHSDGYHLLSVTVMLQ